MEPFPRIIIVFKEIQGFVHKFGLKRQVGRRNV